jgi:hypothetical protein
MFRAGFDKIFDRSIEGGFGFLRKTTSWQFVIFKMIAETFAAYPLSGTAGISARATFQIFLFLTFHKLFFP